MSFYPIISFYIPNYTRKEEEIISTNNKLSCKMMFELGFLLLLGSISAATMPMTIYNTAQFNPTNVTDLLVTVYPVTTLNACACECYNDSLCITGSFFGINQTCVLFSAYLWQGQLRLIINMFASVFSFSNKTTITGTCFNRDLTKTFVRIIYR